MLHAFLMGLFLTIGTPRDMIVPIESNGPAGNYYGTGFLVDKNHLMTAAHVLNDNGNTYKLYCKNKQIIVDNKKIFVDHKLDLAIVKIDEFCRDEIIKFAKKNPEYGNPIWTIGCPESLGFCGMLTNGIVSLYRARDGRIELLSDIKIWYGNSGGPVLSSDAELIGVVIEIKSFVKLKKQGIELKDVDLQNYAIIIPISEIRSFTKKYVEHKGIFK